jgi:hypothetical protein
MSRKRGGCQKENGGVVSKKVIARAKKWLK